MQFDLINLSDDGENDATRSEKGYEQAKTTLSEEESEDEYFCSNCQKIVKLSQISNCSFAGHSLIQGVDYKEQKQTELQQAKIKYETCIQSLNTIEKQYRKRFTDFTKIIENKFQSFKTSYLKSLEKIQKEYSGITRVEGAEISKDAHVLSEIIDQYEQSRNNLSKNLEKLPNVLESFDNLETSFLKVFLLPQKSEETINNCKKKITSNIKFLKETNQLKEIHVKIEEKQQDEEASPNSQSCKIITEEEAEINMGEKMNQKFVKKRQSSQNTTEQQKPQQNFENIDITKSMNVNRPHQHDPTNQIQEESNNFSNLPNLQSNQKALVQQQEEEQLANSQVKAGSNNNANPMNNSISKFFQSDNQNMSSSITVSKPRVDKSNSDEEEEKVIEEIVPQQDPMQQPQKLIKNSFQQYSGTTTAGAIGSNLNTEHKRPVSVLQQTPKNRGSTGIHSPPNAKYPSTQSPPRNRGMIDVNSKRLSQHDIASDFEDTQAFHSSANNSMAIFHPLKSQQFHNKQMQDSTFFPKQSMFAPSSMFQSTQSSTQFGGINSSSFQTSQKLADTQYISTQQFQSSLEKMNDPAYEETAKASINKWVGENSNVEVQQQSSQSSQKAYYKSTNFKWYRYGSLIKELIKDNAELNDYLKDFKKFNKKYFYDFIVISIDDAEEIRRMKKAICKRVLIFIENGGLENIWKGKKKVENADELLGYKASIISALESSANYSERRSHV